MSAAMREDGRGHGRGDSRGDSRGDGQPADRDDDRDDAPTLDEAERATLVASTATVPGSTGATVSAVRFPVASSTSANTGVAPQ